MRTPFIEADSWENKFNDGHMDGWFAATPPLEALRFLVHEAATVRSN